MRSCGRFENIKPEFSPRTNTTVQMYKQTRTLDQNNSFQQNIGVQLRLL